MEFAEMIEQCRLDILGSVDVDPALSVCKPGDAAPDGRIFLTDTMENEYPLCLANGMSLRFRGSSTVTVCELLPSLSAGSESCAARPVGPPQLPGCLRVHAHRVWSKNP